MEWSLDEGDIPEEPDEPPDFWISISASAGVGQDDDRKIGPARLMHEPVGQGAKVLSRQGLLRGQNERGVVAETVC
jgi:hypothetical protein